MRRIGLLLALSCLFGVVCAASEIKVSDQIGFDTLGETLVREINRGEKNITVDIMPGHYFFHDNHIALGGIKKPDVSITIVGHNAIVSGAGSRGEFSLDAGYVDVKNRAAVSSVPNMKEALGLAEIVDKENGVWRMKVDEKPVKAKKISETYILITQWFLAKYYPVREIADGYVFFIAPGAEDTTTNASLNPNCDYRYGQRYPRYTIVNSPLSRDFRVKKNGKIVSGSGKKIIRCDAGCFLSLRACRLRSLKMTGLTFLGSGKADAFLDIYRDDISSGILVSDCNFVGIKGVVLRIIATPDVCFSGNTIRGCHSSGVVSFYESNRTVVKNNRFYDNGTDVGQFFCVQCRGPEFLISGNYFEDFTYAAIGFGVWYKSDEPQICSGIVENNECCLSPRYNSGVFRNLMDSGAIYSGTINKDVTLRGNYVHDISGPKDNRGIFCDDGTVNVKIIGNRVERISNSYCIDLRRVEYIETLAGSRIKRTNVGNSMKDNVVDGEVRFVNLD